MGFAPRLARIRWPRETHPASHTERLVSAAGGFVAILLVMLISDLWLDPQASLLIATSMGASAVLLFAVPHGSLSQPWPLVGGHLLSGVIGITCARWIDPPLLAAALAVGLAIGAMYYLRCLHPPGGATALTAVVGGPGVQALGYEYLLTPLGINLAIILAVAILFNLPFAWRRYPRILPRSQPSVQEPMIAHSDLVYALSQVDSFIDVNEEDLLRIYALAMGHGPSASTDAGSKNSQQV